jgi:hypothetical protein
MEVSEEQLRKNIDFFTQIDPVGRVVYKRLEKL